MSRGKINNKSANFDLKTTFWTVAGIIFVLIFIFSLDSKKTGSDEIRMTIDFGDGTKRNFLTSAKEGTTAWDMLQQANAVYGIPVEIEGNFEPKSIGEFTNGEEGKNWNFYLNGRIREESPFEVKLSGGEKVLYKFE